jgi:hypothetical protein
MRSFRYTSFFLLCFFLYLVPGSINSQPVDTVTSKPTWVPPLGSRFDKALFKASLDISKHHLTGLLFMKQTSDTSVRMVFSNEIGMNYFDFEFVREQFVIHYCFPSLSRKSLLKILESDFRLLLPDNSVKILKVLHPAENPSDTEYKVKSTAGRYFYTLENNSKRISLITSSGKFLKKTRIIFSSTGIGVPGKIRILNPTIKLTLSLTLFNN